jgi:S1-C subfamily serine protease
MSDTREHPSEHPRENPIESQAFELSELLAGAVAKAGESVVQVSARRGVGSSGVVWSADGVVVAADHNIEREEEITLGLPDGGTVPAKLVGRDPSTDIAVLRAEASGLAIPEWGDVAALKVGHLALGVLRPGRSIRAAFGIVSALGDEWRTPGGGRLGRYVQADLGILKGFSGSLIVDVKGRALGLGTAGLLRGHAMVIPPETLNRVVGALLEHGRIPRGQLGLGLVPLRLPAPLEEATGQPTALMVVLIQPGSAAEKAGILLGDILISLDGHPVSDLSQLHSLLGEDRVGKPASLSLVRAGELRTLDVTIQARER